MDLREIENKYNVNVLFEKDDEITIQPRTDICYKSEWLDDFEVIEIRFSKREVRLKKSVANKG